MTFKDMEERERAISDAQTDDTIDAEDLAAAAYDVLGTFEGIEIALEDYEWEKAHPPEPKQRSRIRGGRKTARLKKAA